MEWNWMLFVGCVILGWSIVELVRRRSTRINTARSTSGPATDDRANNDESWSYDSIRTAVERVDQAGFELVCDIFGSLPNGDVVTAAIGQKDDKAVLLLTTLRDDGTRQKGLATPFLISDANVTATIDGIIATISYDDERKAFGLHLRDSIGGIILPA